jgi:hypothetical protein
MLQEITVKVLLLRNSDFLRHFRNLNFKKAGIYKTLFKNLSLLFAQKILEKNCCRIRFMIF